jgi:hypothetical protein
MFAAPDQFDAAPSETGDNDNDIYYVEISVLKYDPAIEANDRRLIKVVQEG